MILRFLPLGLILLAVLCVAVAAVLPISRTKGQVRLAGSLSLGAAFAVGSLLSTTGQSWQRGVGVVMGAFLAWIGLRKDRRDPDGKTSARSMF